ncbi:acyltransferase [Sphingomonas sp.]|jgi:acetyltransferase-like isoleucine patch superfamily enzyme|uniref:acyltransferase n=1 Tax=Sphingomonas sp. TaxID=28214 RepID=UPI002DEA117C|nr:acyltransferase [Sphingomonas sp.]
MTDEKLRYGYYEPSKWQSLKIRLLQLIARLSPGGPSFRVRLHRARGVKIGDNVFIGYDSILETNRPWLIEIEDDVMIGVRTTLIAHFGGTEGLKIEKGAYIGVGSIILPNVVIGAGAVVTAGSVVSKSVPPLTVVQGNPAVPIARCTEPLGFNSVKSFARKMRPL